MARHETRVIANYMRNGSLWVGRFVAGDGELDFGDDRFDAAHGLANLVHADPANSANETDRRTQAWKGAASVAKSNAPVFELVA